MDFIPLMAPNLLDEDIAAAVKVLKSGMLVQGAQVQALEEQLADFIGVKHAVAVSNGTASLHLALLALGIGPGDEVLVPAFSYVATANVVELVGAKPVFVDIDISTFNIDLNLIEREINANTKAIIPVHEFGLASEIRDITAIAQKHNLFVVEDAACALGAYENNQLVGSFGDVGSFSFHPRKAITSGEGGLITTNSDEIARKVRVLRNHGIEMIEGKMEFVAAGFNYRLTDFQAALIRSQFDRFNQNLAIKEAMANFYNDHLITNKVKLPGHPINKNHTWQTYHVLLSESVDRDEIIGKLRNSGIGANYGAQCIPAQQFYKHKYNLNSRQLFANAYNAYSQGLALPLYEKLTKGDLEQVVFEFNKIINSYLIIS